MLLMLDYDGTLTPITDHYDDAQISPERISFLRQISKTPNIRLAIVSGRSILRLISFLKPLVGEKLILVGLHGGEIYDMEDEKYISEPPNKYKSAVSAIKNYLVQQGTDKLPGIEFEDKNFSLVLHYRLASDEDSILAMNCLKDGLNSLGLSVDFILRPGKKLLEAVPKGFNKGVGVKSLVKLVEDQLGERPFPVYIGDDITDFDAFRVVNSYDGYTLYVGKNLPADAPWVNLNLPNVEAVYDFLERVIPLLVNIDRVSCLSSSEIATAPKGPWQSPPL